MKRKFRALLFTGGFKLFQLGKAAAVQVVSSPTLHLCHLQATGIDLSHEFCPGKICAFHLFSFWWG